jgi:hypothetical protein
MLTFGVLGLPVRNWPFSVFLAALYTLYGWVVDSASRMSPKTPDGSFMQHLGKLPASWAGLCDVLSTFARILFHSPGSVVFSLLIIGGLFAFCAAKRTWVRLVAGGGHGLAHILLDVLLVWLFAKVNLGLGLALDSSRQVAVFSAEMLVVGGLLGGVLMALYLLLFSFVGGFHLDEAYASQSLADYKNFLRLHVDATGKLTIYPVGVPTVCKSWTFQPGASNGQPWFEPADGKPIATELIEEPVPVV